MLDLLKPNLPKAIVDIALSSIINEDIVIRVGERVALSIRIEDAGTTEDGRRVYKISGRLVK